MNRILALALCAVLLSTAPTSALLAQPQKKQQDKPQLKNPSERDAGGATARLAEEVRHKLVTLPYYGVFDWLEGTVLPGGAVELRGAVVRPTTKSDAEKRVKSIESVSRVVNKIEVLPVSQFDDDIRRQTYRAIFNYDSPLFQYSIRAVPPIHIIAKRGRVTLKGVVLNKMDRQLAETAARGVPSVFAVTNELKVENSETSSR